MNQKICKHMHINFTQMSEKKHQFDIDHEGNPHSFRGYWTLPKLPICLKFDSEKIQFRESQGFFYCDKLKCEKCVFFEELKKGGSDGQ